MYALQQTWIDWVTDEYGILFPYFIDADDWLQEEYTKIKNNQALASLQLKLDKFQRREEYFNELQKRVAASKANLNKIDHYFKKNVKEDISDKSDDKNDLDVEDDLMIDEMEAKDDDDSESEELVEESDPVTKVCKDFVYFYLHM